MKKGILPGLLLILLGGYLLAAQFLPLPEGIGMICIGAALIAYRLVRGRGYGFTIAGCVVMAVGLSTAVESSGLLELLRIEFLRESLFFFLLALAFFAIHIVEYRHIGNWPLIPGICLLIVGASVTVAENPAYFGSIWRLWPIALICVGAAMLTGAFARQRQGARGYDPGEWDGREEEPQTEEPQAEGPRADGGGGPKPDGPDRGDAS